MGSYSSKKRKYNEVLEVGSELVEFYLQNPCIAVYDLLGVDLAPIQRIMFEDFWFKNYVMAICGRGGGKSFMLGALATLSCMLRPGYRVGLLAPVFRQSVCVMLPDTYDTFWTSDGLQTTAQSFYASIEEGVTKTQSLDYQNIILSKWKNSERACRSIKTSKGFELAGTVDHGILILNDELDLVFKDLQDITKEDTIVIRRGFEYFGNDDLMPLFDEFKIDWRTKDCKIPKELTIDLAYFMGLLVGDGCVCISEKGGKYRTDFVNEDQDLLDSFEKYLIEYFVDDPENIDRRNRKNKTWEIQYFSKKLVYYLLKCGFTATTALDKKIPGVIKKASQGCVREFLIGLMDTDGCVYIQQNKGCTISLNTSSLQLAKEVQACFLNFGIVSNLCIGNKAAYKCLIGRTKKSKCAESYKVRITGQYDIINYFNEIGFKCERKRKKLSDYLDTHFNREISLGTSLGLPQKLVNTNYTKCEGYLNRGLYFVKMIESNYFFAPTIDVEVENESCYWSNGFISHNSKMIFAEVEKLYAQSSLLREACDRPPTRRTDACVLQFKSVGGRTPSYIEALPLGADGSKIRGSRFYLLLIDEFAQMPSKVIDTVLMPMGATSLAPMERVRRLEQKARLISLGLATDTDFEEESVNKMIMTSSGFYKFNHMWKRMKDHWGQEILAEKEGRESQYAVWQVPYWDLPEGFLDANNVAEAKRVMSNAEFRMEYEAEMISDSEGFFKASLLEACSADSGFTIEMRGDPKAQYLIGVDPNQGGRASCGIIILRVGSANKIVRVLELRTQTTQQLTQVIQDLCEKLNVIRVFMDKGGGGKAVCDLLEEGYGGKQPIIDRTNDDHRHLPGSHILELIYFNPNWIADANFTVKAMLEDKKLLFPEPPIGSTLDIEAANYDTVNTLKSQMLNIIVTQTSTGILHFDTPQKGQNKDLYSALLLASHGAKIVEKELEGDGEPVLFNSGGLVRLHDRQSGGFDQITPLSGRVVGKSVIHSAVLKKKFK